MMFIGDLGEFVKGFSIKWDKSTSSNPHREITKSSKMSYCRSEL